MALPRVFDVPVEQVWKAWSDPRLVTRWWGPNGFTAPVVRMDFREGGTSLVCMRAPQEFGGQDLYNSWTYQRIVPLQRIEFVQHFTDPDGNPIHPTEVGLPAEIPFEVPHVITFKALSNEKTEVTVTEYGYPAEQIVEISRAGMDQCLDKMAALWALGSTRRVTSKDGTQIAFDRVGAGPAVILVDGALAYREHFGGRPLAAELSIDFTVITYDRRGRGGSSDTPPYAVEREIEDIEALIDEAGSPVKLYGFSSGAVLALKTAARLGDKVARLALHEPPLDSGGDDARQDFAAFTRHMADLLAANRRSEAVAFFFADMLPTEMIEDMKQSPEWPLMESVAQTLAYDNAVVGDGSIPVEAAKAVTMPALILVGSESPAFKHEAAEALVKAMPHAAWKTLEGQSTVVPPEVLAPVLKEFFHSG
jgi:pimeloyl-ACP methyl ester carboxylesterase